ncbi:hypothetical protein [Deinococcus roseus]|uniref:DUF5668 domain-containing protein n=1 Tax=Deinococcus roseus TaxID=392414 RepID=A0ABQ2D4Q5_9DEIO|nr:hypothetical protein [Deinococcus roseus]GGJ43095.1 hypothetical protein GCM10008938_31650 [Deinococcus roseus]
MEKSSEGWKLLTVGLIVTGVILTLVFTLQVGLPNWWAWFIVFPGIMGWSLAYQWYQKEGYTPRVGGTFALGLPVVLTGLIFVLNLDWGRVWPLYILMAGAMALLSPYTLLKGQASKTQQFKAVK